MAEFIVYRSYNEFLQNKGEEFDEFLSLKRRGKTTKLVLMNDNEEVEIQSATIWGFSWEGKLFRISNDQEYAVRVMSVGKICHYENGYYHFDIISKGYAKKMYYDTGSKEGFKYAGHEEYISETLNSEIITLPDSKGVPDYFRKRMKKYFKAHPEYNSFYECINEGYISETISDCLKEFEDPDQVKFY